MDDNSNRPDLSPMSYGPFSWPLNCPKNSRNPRIAFHRPRIVAVCGLFIPSPLEFGPDGAEGPRPIFFGGEMDPIC
jgi:hypothetical protein